MAFDPQAITQFPPVALEGLLADLGVREVESYLAEVAIYAGRGVVLGAAEDQVKLPVLGADVSAHFRGFTFYEAMREPVPAGPQYRVKDAVPVLRKGRLWLLAAGDVVTDGPVYIVNGSGAGVAGTLRGDANGGAATLVSRAMVRRGALSSALALVEINLV